MSKQKPSSAPTLHEISYALRRAVSLLPEEKQTEVQELIQKSQKGKSARTLSRALQVARASPEARTWLESALYLSGETRAYVGLSGQVGEIPARSLWKCPKCGFTWRVLRKGRPVPPCPRDGSTLEPVVIKEQNDAG